MKRITVCALCCVLLSVLLLPCFALSESEEDVLAYDRPLLVNRDYPIDVSLVPADLVQLSEVLDSSIRLKTKGIMAVRTAAEALDVMLSAARAEGISNWQVGTAYRSSKEQQRILDNKIAAYRKQNPGWSRSKARSAALRTVQEPGCSEHQLGLAFDINVPGRSFKGTKQCTWLHEHCWEYGFILRYQEGKESITGISAEAWHIRYVGVEHSLYMRDHDLCLEEYLADYPEPDPQEFVVEDIPLEELFAS